MSWNPLSSSLLTSSLLSEGPDAVAVMALFIASADRYGESDLTAPAVASLLRISTDRAAAAFAVLAAPDPHSRTSAHGGARIVRTEEGTWFLPSHAKHRAMMGKDKAAERQARYRERLKRARCELCSVVGCNRPSAATTPDGRALCSAHSFADVKAAAAREPGEEG